MSEIATGRHRAPGKYNPLSELSNAVSRSAEPAVKTSAVLAASGGLVAAFALPAQAGAEADTQTLAKVDATATAGDKATTLVSTKTAPAITAPAVTAPATVSPAAAPDFGALGFKAIAKPAPTPDRTTSQASRSSDRTSLAAPTRPATGGVLAIAASLVGIYYSYGGTSPSTGFDCSGFTQYVFAQVGISLPRTAEEQRLAVTPVSTPQPGDLVFFGIPAYHEGIYAGNGMMYDSPRTGKAVALRSIWSSDVTYGRP